jgi:hypothetical protein
MKKVVNATKEELKKDRGALFIPACLFLGMGWGFVSYNFTGGLFLGLGAGFLLFALVNLLKKD